LISYRFTHAPEVLLLNDCEQIEILNSLGLTLNEARVLFALSKLGTATAKAVSKSSGISREVVYQTMSRLQKKRLVGELLSSPKLFKALPIKDVYEILLEHKKEKDKELNSKVKKALKTRWQTDDLQANETQETMVTPRGKNRAFITKEYENARVSVDMIIPLNKFIEWSQTHAEKCIDGAIKGNAKIRLITEKAVQEIIAKKAKLSGGNLTSKLQYVEYRFVPDVPRIEMAVFDRKTVFVATCKEKLIKNMVWLRSNNPAITEMANKYFDTTWREAEQPENSELPLSLISLQKTPSPDRKKQH
jgi:sugar-specific transcriptional regulator TrmB